MVTNQAMPVSPSKARAWSFLRTSTILLTVFMFVGLIPVTAQELSLKLLPAQEKTDLDQVLANLTITLVRQGDLEGKAVIFGSHDLYDAITGLSLPLAKLLRSKLMTAMDHQGVRVLLPGTNEDRFMFLQGTWQRHKDDLSIDLRVLNLGGQGPEAVATASATLPLEIIDAALLTPDRESWARYLLRKMEELCFACTVLRIYVHPFSVNGIKGSDTDLGGYMEGWIKTAMAESRLFVVMDPKSSLIDKPINVLKTRGTRSIGREKTSLTADLLVVDGEMRGDLWLHTDRGRVEVRVEVTAANNSQITAATADIPAKLFPNILLGTQSMPKSAPSQSVQPGLGSVSINGLEVELTSTAGEKAVYSSGEEIRFALRLNRRAWVYLFDLNPVGQAILLHPVNEFGRLLMQGNQERLQAGTTLIIPDIGSPYSLVAEPPYGRDNLWAVASEQPLSIPSILDGDWAKPKILIDRIRKQGFSHGTGYAEAHIEVITKP